MVSFTASFEVIRDEFSKRGISYERPGFYDDPSFIKYEKQNPIFLNNYARFVQQKRYDRAYLNKARKEIPIIARAIYGELLHDGRQGACVDTSAVLSRILEREGFWNFCIKGSLTITYPKSSGLQKRYFWSVDQGDFVAGHAWVFAPPYCVVDITLKEQLHTVEELQHLPNFILSENAAVGVANVDDIISPIVRRVLSGSGISVDRHLNAVNPVLETFLATFDTYTVIDGNTNLKYVPIAIGASDCSLEEMIGVSPDGKSGMSIYRDAVVPNLTALRE